MVRRAHAGPLPFGEAGGGLIHARLALGGGLGICLAVSLLVVQVAQVAPVAPTQNADQQKSVQEAFEIMASSDNSDADSSSSSAPSTSWQDSSL